jgi:hypothetical protein
VRLDHLLRQAGRPDLALLNPDQYAYVLTLVSAATVGAVLASRRPRHPVGWLLLALGLSVVAAGVAQGYAGYGLLARPGSLPGARWVAMAAGLLTSSGKCVAARCWADLRPSRLVSDCQGLLHDHLATLTVTTAVRLGEYAGLLAGSIASAVAGIAIGRHWITAHTLVPRWCSGFCPATRQAGKRAGRRALGRFRHRSGVRRSARRNGNGRSPSLWQPGAPGRPARNAGRPRRTPDSARADGHAARTRRRSSCR